MRRPKLKTCITAITLLFLLAGPAISQENFLPGYVVHFNGDTVQGFVDYRNWEQNPRRVNFMETMGGAASSFTPYTISSFSVKDELYISAMVEKEISMTQVGELDDYPDLNLVKDTVFLKALVLGEKNLYYLKFELGRENFFIRLDQEWMLLKYKRYLMMKDGYDYATEKKTYIGQLSAYLQECPTIMNKLTGVKYKPTSMQNAIRNYYKCVDIEPEYQYAKEKVKVEFSVLAGLSVTTLTYLYYGQEFEKFEPSVSFSGGAALDVVLPFNQRKFSINNELVYSGYSIDGRYENIHNENYYTISEGSATLHYMKLNNMFRFKYPFGQWFAFINAGISNGLIVASKTYSQQWKKFYGPEEYTESHGTVGGRSLEQSYLLGLGARFRHFSLEARFERGNGTALYINESTKTNRYYFLFGYRF